MWRFAFWNYLLYNGLKIERTIIFMNILGEKFKLQRKKLGLSQKSLAEGICEQSQISKIERGHFIPSADLLFKLSQRLEVPLDYFFNDEIEIKSNLSNFKHLSSRLLDDRNYDDL